MRQGADVMPKKQLNSVLDAELGKDWSSKLKSFDFEPLAAASIGQVSIIPFLSLIGLWNLSGQYCSLIYLFSLCLR